MIPDYLKTQLITPIVSLSGNMIYTFTIETKSEGKVNAFDSELKVNIISKWELSYDEANNLLITFKDFKKRIGKWVCHGLTCSFIEMKFNLREIESAYDLVGE